MSAVGDVRNKGGTWSVDAICRALEKKGFFVLEPLKELNGGKKLFFVWGHDSKVKRDDFLYSARLEFKAVNVASCFSQRRYWGDGVADKAALLPFDQRPQWVLYSGQRWIKRNNR